MDSSATPVSRSAAARGEAPLRLALIGLGKLGTAVAEGLAASPDARIVAAVDPDPTKVGRRLADLIDGSHAGVEISADLPAETEVDVAVVMTSSYMREIKPVVAEYVARGMNVLTSAEELAYPWVEFPEESRELDALARAHGVSVLGAGANPGFLMDALPVAMTLVSQEIRRITITRTLDLRPQRFHRAERFGIGVTPEVAAERSAYSGHSGFEQSIRAVADALSWHLDAVEVSVVEPAIVATTARVGEHFTIEPGQIAVVEQRAVGRSGGVALIELREYFGFIDVDDALLHGDTYEIDGVDQSFTVSIAPGVLSYATTPAVLVNLVAPTADAPPGLLTSLDFRVRDLASKGALRATERPHPAAGLA